MTAGARRLAVRVIPRARRRAVEPTGPDAFTVRVNEPPEDGRANAAVIEALAEHLGVPRRRLVLVRGERDRRKVIELQP